MSCSNATIVLRSAIKAFVLSLESVTISHANMMLTDSSVDVEVSPGAGGPQGKITACVSIAANTATTSASEIDSLSVQAERLQYRVVAAADGGISLGVGCLLVFCAGTISQLIAKVGHVEMESVAAGSTLSSMSISAGLSAVVVAATIAVISVSGNATLSTIVVTACSLDVEQRYFIPAGSISQFTVSSIAVMYIPGGMSMGTISIDRCTVTLLNVSEGVGLATTTPRAAPSSSSGSWDGSFVSIIGTFSQAAAVNLLPSFEAVIIMEMIDSSVGTLTAPSILSALTVNITNASVVVRTSSWSPTAMAMVLSSLCISVFALTETTLDQGVVVQIMNFTLAGFQEEDHSEDDTVLHAITCDEGQTRGDTATSSFGPIIGLFGNCVLGSNSTIMVSQARGIRGPMLAAYTAAQNPAVLAIHANSTLQFDDVFSSGLISEGSLFGKTSSSSAGATFTIHMLTVDDVVNSVAAAMLKAGVFLSASVLCGFGYLVGADTTVVAPNPSRSNVTLHCNVWSPLPLSTLVLVSSQRLPINAVTTVASGGSIRSYGKLDDWDRSCPFPHANISHTMTVSAATNEVIVSFLFPPPSVRSASSVVVGITISVGSLVGVGSYAGAIHGIQAAMLVIRVQTLCADSDEDAGGGASSSSSALTPDDLCCDLGTSPTQLTVPDYGGVYLGGVLGNCAVVVTSTVMRFAAGKTVHHVVGLLNVKAHLQQTFFSGLLRRLQALAPPSGPVTLSWTSYMFLLCPTVSLCVALVSDVTTPQYARLVAGCLLPLILLPWAGAFVGLCWWGRRVEFAFRGIEPTKNSEAPAEDAKSRRIRQRPQRRHGCSLPTFREAHAWLFLETEELAPRRGVHCKELATEQLRRFGSVFASYRASRYWCFNVEVWFAIATGVATGLMLRQMSRTDPCAGSGWGWAVVGVGIAETTTALVVRAFALRLELVVFASVMVFTILAEVVALLNPNAVNVANALSTVAAVLQLFSILYGAFEHFLLRFRVSRLNASLQTNSNDSLFQTNNDHRSSPLLASSFDDQRSLDATVTTSTLIHLSMTEESQRVNDALENMIEMICAGRSVL